jgi:hypothetical protein
MSDQVKASMAGERGKPEPAGGSRLFRPTRVGPHLSAQERDADTRASTALRAFRGGSTPAVSDSGHFDGHLGADTRRGFGAAFGHDFSRVRIHAGPEASRAAAQLGTSAYTLGSDIVLGAAVSRLPPWNRQALLAHELAHTVQNATQPDGGVAVAHRAPPPGPTAPASRPDSPAGLPPGHYKVILVGAPGSAEVKSGHPFQFAKAAAQSDFGRDANTVWLVERTGYELGKISKSDLEAFASPSIVFWVDPDNGLAEAIKSFPPQSIGSMEAYGHGTPGLLAMRHGWPGQADYGLSTAQAKSLSPSAFAPDATISFDSCNSAAVAEAIAQSTERPAQGWVGRTSYHDVNVGTGGVRGSEVFTEGGVDPTEAGSRMLGRDPEKLTYAPASSSGDFQSYYSITARLPKTRRFPVGAHGTVSLTISAQSEVEAIRGGQVTVILHKENRFFDDDIDPTHEVEIGKSGTFAWSGLEQGTYYIEIFHLSGMLVEGNVSVKIR